MKEVMVHMYIEKQNRFPYLSFAHVFLILWRKAEFIYPWWLLGITKMAGQFLSVFQDGGHVKFPTLGNV